MGMLLQKSALSQVPKHELQRKEQQAYFRH